MVAPPLVRVEILFGHLISGRKVTLYAELPEALAERLAHISQTVMVTEQDAAIVGLWRECLIKAKDRTRTSPYWRKAADDMQVISVLTNHQSDVGGFTILRVKLNIIGSGND